MPGSTNIPSTKGAPTGFSIDVVDDDAIVRAWVRQPLGPPMLLTTPAREEGLNEAAREAGAQGVVRERSDPEAVLTALRLVAESRHYVEVEDPRRRRDQVTLSERERGLL